MNAQPVLIELSSPVSHDSRNLQRHESWQFFSIQFFLSCVASSGCFFSPLYAVSRSNVGSTSHNTKMKTSNLHADDFERRTRIENSPRSQREKGRTKFIIESLKYSNSFRNNVNYFSSTLCSQLTTHRISKSLSVGTNVGHTQDRDCEGAFYSFQLRIIIMRANSRVVAAAI